MTDLKPCPFCGGEAELFQHYPYMRRRVVSSVCCKSCRANSGTWGRKDKAIETWNTRKPMEEMVAELEDAYYEFYSMEQHDKENPFNEGLLEGYKRTLEIVRGKE